MRTHTREVKHSYIYIKSSEAYLERFDDEILVWTSSSGEASSDFGDELQRGLVVHGDHRSFFGETEYGGGVEWRGNEGSVASEFTKFALARVSDDGVVLLFLTEFRWWRIPPLHARED